jgi:hypothetical protein
LNYRTLSDTGNGIREAQWQQSIVEREDLTGKMGLEGTIATTQDPLKMRPFKSLIPHAVYNVSAMTRAVEVHAGGLSD